MANYGTPAPLAGRARKKHHSRERAPAGDRPPRCRACRQEPEVRTDPITGATYERCACGIRWLSPGFGGA